MTIRGSKREPLAKVGPLHSTIGSGTNYTMGTEDIVNGADSLVIACRHCFGTGDVRLMDDSGRTFSKVRFEVETLSDGSEIFNAVLLED